MIKTWDKLNLFQNKYEFVLGATYCRLVLSPIIFWGILVMSQGNTKMSPHVSFEDNLSVIS
jgi:hypothetical protein